MDGEALEKDKVSDVCGKERESDSRMTIKDLNKCFHSSKTFFFRLLLILNKVCFCLVSLVFKKKKVCSLNL